MQCALPLALLFLLMKILHGGEVERNGCNTGEADKDMGVLQVERPIRACSFEATHFKTTGSEEGFRNHFRRSRGPDCVITIHLNKLIPERKVMQKRAFKSDGYLNINKTEDGSRNKPLECVKTNYSKSSNNSIAEEKKGFFKSILQTCFSKDRKSNLSKTDGNPKNSKMKNKKIHSGKELESALSYSTRLVVISAVPRREPERSSIGAMESSAAEGTEEPLDYEHNPDLYPEPHPLGSETVLESTINTKIVKKTTGPRRAFNTVSPMPGRNDIESRVEPIDDPFTLGAPSATGRLQLRRFENFLGKGETESISEAPRAPPRFNKHSMNAERNPMNDFQDLRKYIGVSTKKINGPYLQMKSQNFLHDFGSNDALQKFLSSSTTGIYEHFEGFRKFSVTQTPRPTDTTRDFFKESILKKHFDEEVTTTKTGRRDADELVEKMAKIFMEKNRQFLVSEKYFLNSKSYTDSSLPRNSRRIFVRPNKKKNLKDRLDYHFKKGKGNLNENQIVEKNVAKYLPSSDDLDLTNPLDNGFPEPKKSLESELLELGELKGDEEERVHYTTSLRESNSFKNEINLLVPDSDSMNDKIGLGTPPILTQNLDMQRNPFCNTAKENVLGENYVTYNNSNLVNSVTTDYDLVFNASSAYYKNTFAHIGLTPQCNELLSSEKNAKVDEDYLFNNKTGKNKVIQSQQKKYSGETSDKKILAQSNCQNAFESSLNQLKFLNQSVPKNIMLLENPPVLTGMETRDLPKNPNITQLAKITNVFKVFGNMQDANTTLFRAANEYHSHEFSSNKNCTKSENSKALKLAESKQAENEFKVGDTPNDTNKMVVVENEFHHKECSKNPSNTESEYNKNALKSVGYKRTETTTMIRPGNTFSLSGISKNPNNSELENVFKLIRDLRGNTTLPTKTGTVQQKVSTLLNCNDSIQNPSLVKQYIIKELESLKKKSQNQNPLLLSYEAKHFQRLADILSAMKSSLLLKGVLNTVNLSTDIRPPYCLNEEDLPASTKYSWPKQKAGSKKKYTTSSAARKNTRLSKLSKECPTDSLEMSFTVDEEDDAEVTCPLELTETTASTECCTTNPCSTSKRPCTTECGSTKFKAAQTSRTSTCSATSTSCQTTRTSTCSTGSTSCQTSRTSTCSTGSTSQTTRTSTCSTDSTSSQTTRTSTCSTDSTSSQTTRTSSCSTGSTSSQTTRISTSSTGSTSSQTTRISSSSTGSTSSQTTRISSSSTGSTSSQNTRTSTSTVTSTFNCSDKSAPSAAVSLSTQASTKNGNAKSSKPGEVCKNIINTLLQYITTLCPSDLTLDDMEETKLKATEHIKIINRVIENVTREAKNTLFDNTERNIHAVSLPASKFRVCTCKRSSSVPLVKTVHFLSGQTEKFKNVSVNSDDAMRLIIQSLDSQSRESHPNITILLNDLTRNSSRAYISHGGLQNTSKSRGQVSSAIQKSVPLDNLPRNTCRYKLVKVDDEVFNKNKWKSSRTILEKGNNVARVKIFFPNSKNNSIDLSIVKNKGLLNSICKKNAN